MYLIIFFSNLILGKMIWRKSNRTFQQEWLIFRSFKMMINDFYFKINLNIKIVIFFFFLSFNYFYFIYDLVLINLNIIFKILIYFSFSKIIIIF